MVKFKDAIVWWVPRGWEQWGLPGARTSPTTLAREQGRPGASPSPGCWHGDRDGPRPMGRQGGESPRESGRAVKASQGPHTEAVILAVHGH